MLDPFHLQRVNKLYRKYINQSGSTKKNICWYRTQKLPKNINIYLRNYQTETAIFLASKHEKTVMACSYLNFSIPTENTSTANLWGVWGICDELLNENDIESVLVNFCCYEYGTNASEAVQKISTRTLRRELCQLTNS